MKKTIILSSVAVLGALSASAHATLIDFNSLSEGTIVSNQFAGVTFAAGTGGLTVPFAANGIGSWASNTGMDVTLWNGGNVGGGVTAPINGMLLHGFNSWLSENGDPVFNMTFASNVTDISIDFGGVFSPGDVRILAYKTGNTTASYSVAATSTNTSTISLAGMTGVTKIVVTPGSFNDWVGVDNIKYTTDSVPEPASLAILGVGALALIRRRRTTKS